MTREVFEESGYRENWCPTCKEFVGMDHADDWDDNNRHIMASGYCGGCGHVFYQWGAPNDMMKDIQKILYRQWQTVGGYCSQDRLELQDLAVIVKELAPQRVLEIGVCEGGWLWCMEPFFAPGAQIIGIDDLSNPVIRIANLRSLISRLGKTHPTTLIEGDSQAPEVLAKVVELLAGEQLDLLHIDGGHDEETARSDWVRYSPLVRKGGIVAIHDIRGVGYKEQEVDRLWAEIEANETLTTRVISHRNDMMGIGVVQL